MYANPLDDLLAVNLLENQELFLVLFIYFNIFEQSSKNYFCNAKFLKIFMVVFSKPKNTEKTQEKL